MPSFGNGMKKITSEQYRLVLDWEGGRKKMYEGLILM